MQKSHLTGAPSSQAMEASGCHSPPWLSCSVTARPRSPRSKPERIPKPPLAPRLDEIFETDGHFARLQALVENTSVLPWFRDLYLVEGEASELRTYESYLIPGLLQTESYARAAVEAARPMLSPADVDKA